MNLSAFENPGKFWRGNIHTHSNLSDGLLDPGEVCRRYKNQGYDFISVTDHFIGLYDYPLTDTSGFRDENFTTLIGAELHSGALENGELWHILAVGLPTDFKPSNSPHFLPIRDQESGPEIALRAVNAGAFVAIAHPHWSGLSFKDALSISAAHAVEVYNHGCAVGADRADGFHTLDLLLSNNRRLNLIATDDAHFTEPDHFGGWLMVKSEENEPEYLLNALKSGAFYSSQGPELKDISISEKKINIHTSAVSSVILQGQGSAATAHHGESITKISLSLSRFLKGGWVRVTAVDQANKKAWSNPILLKKE